MQEIYTDGSCLGNPGPGGFAFIINNEDNELWYSEGQQSTTNNQMELTAVIECLDYVKEKCIIYTDSKYVINCAKGVWKRKANVDLWKKYDIATKNKTIHFEWVKGHNGNDYNEKVDKMAREEAIKLRGK